MNMKLKTYLAAFLIGLCFSLAQAQETVPIGNQKLEFLVPGGFKLISRNDEVPRYAYANESKTASLEVFVPRVQLPPEDVEGYKETAIGYTEIRFPDLKWLKREIINRGGRKWIYLSYEVTNKNKETTHFDVYITSMKLELMFVTFVSKANEYKRFKGRQQEVINSFKFHRKAESNNPSEGDGQAKSFASRRVLCRVSQQR